jgi:hypothetical protein
MDREKSSIVCSGRMGADSLHFLMHRRIDHMLRQEGRNDSLVFQDYRLV